MSTNKEMKDDFIRWYRELSHRDDRLKIFDRGEYHTVYGKKDAELIADAFFRSRKAMGIFQGNNDKMDCIHLKPKLKEKVIKDNVLRRKRTVEIYRRDEETGKWEIAETVNGSNLSAGSMGEAAFNLCAVVMSIKKETKTLGIALYNHTSSSFEIAEYIEDGQYTKLSSVLVAKGVQRCIFHCQSATQHLVEIQKFEKNVLRHGVHFVDDTNNDGGGSKFWNFIKNEASTIRSIQNIINKQSSKRLQGLVDRTKALAALNGIILHEELQKDDANFYRFSLREYKVNSFMRLDSSALAALNLFPTGNDKPNGNHSLYGVLKRCRSAMGNRMLSTWIRQPLVDIHELHRRQKLVKIFVENTEQRQILREEHFKALVDFEKMVQKLLRDKGKLRDLVELYNFVEKLQWIKDTLHNVGDVDFAECAEEEDDEDDDIKVERETPLNLLRTDFVQPIEGMIADFHDYMAMIEQVVDLPRVQYHEYRISKDFDVLLDKLEKKMQKIKKEMECVRRDVAQDLKEPDKIKLVQHKRRGWCLKATGKSKNKLKPKGKGKKKEKEKYEIIQTVTGGTYFTPIGGELNTLAKSHSQYQKQFDDRQKLIVEKTLEISKTYIPVIEKIIRVFSELDVILSLSCVADEAQTCYVLPTVLPKSRKRVLKMTNARHPCLELIRMDDSGDVIPNDVDMVSGQSSFQVVTGPNMGGKSTYIRMVGLITLMAQIGSYVPCDECTLTMVDSILCRVGAGDNQLKGVSTFMAEMLEASSILEGATEHSLVIIDELGRGTSTYDGYGIAFAISEHIIESLQSFCLFATHFHELSALEAKHPAAVNKHVDVFFDVEQDSLVMLYRIKDGTCPQSYGIQVAKLAKFPDSVIATAKEMAHQLESVDSKQAVQGGTPKLPAEVMQSVRKVVHFARSHGNDTDYQEKLQSLIESEVNVSDAFNDLCNRMSIRANPEGADGMEVDA